ncbi:MAG: hypothetical protein ACYDAA_04090 [Syntrophales bacterium]
METVAMIKSLQDPMGLPFYPFLFQVLMVLTFALHILFVNFALGTSFLAVYGRFKGDPGWRRLSPGLAKAAPANVSMAMLLGVAPLLFVQVVYDPFWYASNLLSAAWVIGFIFIMMAAYSSLYVFYLRGKKGDRKGWVLFGAAAVVLFLLAGVIMHALGYQLLQPEKWQQWYMTGSAADTSGLSLHAFQLPRFLHFIVPSLALTGIFLMLYAWYFKDRRDMDGGHLAWTGATGAKMAFLFTLFQALIGFWWLLSLPAELDFLHSPFFLAGAGLGIGLLLLLYAAQKDPVKYAVLSGFGAFCTIFAMSYAREALRMSYLGRFGYSIFDYKVNVDWPSTLLFLGTFLMALLIIGYLLTVAFQSGRAEGPYEAGPALHRLGKLSIVLLLAWIVVVAGLGVAISLRNYGA